MMGNWKFQIDPEQSSGDCRLQIFDLKAEKGRKG